MQSPRPVQEPDQPLKVEPLSGVAVRVTLLLLAKLPLQVAPQVIPDGVLWTIPLPVPDLVTVKGLTFWDR
jgi:hypothetical protein